MFSPQMITAKAEAQHIALMEQNEAKIKYIPQYSSPAQNNQNKNKILLQLFQILKPKIIQLKFLQMKLVQDNKVQDLLRLNLKWTVYL